MKRATGEERALARATIYRLLALNFSYPTPKVWGGLGLALEGAVVGAELIDEATEVGVAAVANALGAMSQESAEAAYQGVFTLSYNEDCPPYETAFSASHLFQQTHHHGIHYSILDSGRRIRGRDLPHTSQGIGSQGYKGF